mgnify:CR=1 FL=1
MIAQKISEKPLKLLVVEDDRLVSLMLTDSLEHAGYLVTCARSAEEAEELLVGGLRADLAILCLLYTSPSPRD